MEEEAKKLDVHFIQSLALAVNDKDGVIRHIQLTIVQETESGNFHCYFDVVDPSKVKIAVE